MQCQAKCKSTGNQCRRRAVDGKRVCTVHGGLSLGGAASPSFKTGAYSKYLPKRLLDTYQEGLSNPKLLELKDQISLIDTRIVEQLQKMDTGESGMTWQLLKEAFAELQQAIQDDDANKRNSSVAIIGRLIDVGNKDIEIWEAIYEGVEMRRKLAESERRAMLQAEQMLTLSEAMSMIGAILVGVKEHVKDRAALAAINAHVAKIVTIDA